MGTLATASVHWFMPIYKNYKFDEETRKDSPPLSGRPSPPGPVASPSRGSRPAPQGHPSRDPRPPASTPAAACWRPVAR